MSPDEVTRLLDKAVRDHGVAALKERRDGKIAVLADQIERGLQMPQVWAKLQESEKSLDATKKVLTATDLARKEADAVLKAIGTALAAAKIIDDGEAVKADDVKRALKTRRDAQ